MPPVKRFYKAMCIKFLPFEIGLIELAQKRTQVTASKVLRNALALYMRSLDITPEAFRAFFKDFAKTLGRVLGRPSFMPLPAFAARLAFGEMADALLLASQRPVPKQLLESGFRFRHAHLETALRHMLGRGAPDTIGSPSSVPTRREEAACVTTSS